MTVGIWKVIEGHSWNSLAKPCDLAVHLLAEG